MLLVMSFAFERQKRYCNSSTKSRSKPNKTRVDEDSEFYNRSIKPWLQNNCLEMYSTHYEEKSIYNKNIRFIRTLKNKTYKYKDLTNIQTYKYMISI